MDKIKLKDFQLFIESCTNKDGKVSVIEVSMGMERLHYISPTTDDYYRLEMILNESSDNYFTLTVMDADEFSKDIYKQKEGRAVS